MKKLGYLLLAFVLIFSFSCKKHKKAAEQQQPAQDTLVMQQPVLPFEQEVTTDSNTIDTTAATDQVLTVDEQTNQITPVSDQQVQQNQGNIYIIVGSFKNYQNAVKTKTFFSKLGYNPQILPQVAGYNRVAVESFTDLAQARNRLKVLRKKFNRKDFWLLYTK